MMEHEGRWTLIGLVSAGYSCAKRGQPGWRGATRAALAILFCLLLIFLAGWLNQVLTYLCQSLWKCPFGMTLFPLAGISSLNELNQA